MTDPGVALGQVGHDLGGGVGAAVVDDHQLVGGGHGLEHGDGARHHLGEVGRLVVGRHDHRDVDTHDDLRLPLPRWARLAE